MTFTVNISKYKKMYRHACLYGVEWYIGKSIDQLCLLIFFHSYMSKMITSHANLFLKKLPGLIAQRELNAHKYITTLDWTINLNWHSVPQIAIMVYCKQTDYSLLCLNITSIQQTCLWKYHARRYVKITNVIFKQLSDQLWWVMGYWLALSVIYLFIVILL